MSDETAKLPVNHAEKLVNIPIKSVAAFQLTLCPVYVFLRRNEKFVSVKGALDFFTPEELQKLIPLESFFVDRETAEKFEAVRANARHLKDVLTKLAQTTDTPPPPYLISDWAVDQITPLWTADLSLTTQSAIAWVDTFCNPLPAKLYLAQRERDVALFQKHIRVSSWVLFFAIHLGYGSVEFLDQFRTLYFELGATKSEFITGYWELDRLKLLVEKWLSEDATQISLSKIQETRAQKSSQRVCDKLRSRFMRIEREMKAQ